jgi:hypothetical protein
MRGFGAGRAADSDAGSALLVVIVSMLLMSALGSAMVLLTVTETRLAAHHVRAGGLLYAADAAMEYAAAELLARDDWNTALAGLAASALSDGPAGGVRVVSGSTVDLTALTSELRCGPTVGCADADMNAVSSDRPWGVDNPRGQLFAWGRLSRVAPRMTDAADAYLIVWVGDDPGDIDGDPLRDGGADDNPGRGRIALVAHAYGPGGTRRILEATLARTLDEGGTPRSRVVSWREVP